MAKIPGLLLRNGTYYFRIRVPLDLVPAFERKEIKESLKTTSFDEAKRRRNERAVHWDAQFAKARKSPPQSKTRPLLPLSPNQALSLVQEYVAQRDREWRRDSAMDGPETADELWEMKYNVGTDMQALTDPEDPGGGDSIRSTSKRILAGTEFVLGDKGISDPEFSEIVRRGLLELHRRAFARLNEDYSVPYFDHLFGRGDSMGSSGAAITFGEVSAEYLEAYQEDAKFKKIDQKRIDKVKATLEVVREIVGQTTPVVEVSYDACVSFRNTLAKVPKNYRKHYGSIPIQDAIAAAMGDGRPTMAYGTQQGYLNILTGVLKLALKKGLIRSVPSEGLTPHAEKIADADKRIPFTIDQLNAIFSAPLYTGSQDDRENFAKPGPNVTRRARFWVPLICLFTGMRPNEACQLHVEDLSTLLDGVQYFDVVKDQSDKKLKNPTSRRSFPVHPELVKIGLVEYVAGQHSAAEVRLFPELKRDKYGYYSHHLADWFTDAFLKTVIQKEGRQSLYSLRHNFRDALRHADAPDWVLQALGGWNQGNKVSDNYGKKNWPEQLHKWVKRIEFPDLDLSHLYVGGQEKE